MSSDSELKDGKVKVPMDFSKIRSKILFGLTWRQLICFGLAGAVGIPFYLLTKDPLGDTIAASIMMLLVLPFFFFAMYEKDGQPLEKVLMNIIRTKFLRPGIRPYETNNMYSVIQQRISDRDKEERHCEKSNKKGKIRGRKEAIWKDGRKNCRETSSGERPRQGSRSGRT